MGSFVVRLRNRQRLRRKEASEIATTLKARFGAKPFAATEPVDTADAESYRILLVDNQAVVMVTDERPVPTIRGLLLYGATKRYVTVDMGAVKFVYNGADVMAPGVVDADPAIAPGDLVWVRDERNGQPLAVGEALMSGEEMVAARQGKAVRSIHHVGDDLWKLDEV